jgi:hypothetical protein
MRTKETAMNVVNLVFLSCVALTACAETTKTAAPTTASTESVAATKPDRAALETHFKQHVKYPAARADILKACADTPEFTAGEKQWIAANLPEGTYNSADDVLTAVKL